MLYIAPHSRQRRQALRQVFINSSSLLHFLQSNFGSPQME
jgi:hypothetical protein